MRQYELTEIEKRLEKLGCPFAPVRKPEDLLEDHHLLQSGGLLEVEIEPGKTGQLPGLPVEYDESRFTVRYQPPLTGEHSRELLRSLGHDDSEIDELIDSGVLSETRE